MTAATIVRVPHATHSYVCPNGHASTAPHPLTKCPFVPCSSTLRPVGTGSRSYNK